jgi:hypothetical protein
MTSHLCDCKRYLSAMISMRESSAPTHFCVELVGEHVRPPVLPLVLTPLQPKSIHLLQSCWRLSWRSTFHANPFTLIQVL